MQDNERGVQTVKVKEGGPNFMFVVWFVIAAGCSWIINHSVAWALIHGICGFFYLLYLCMGFGGGFGPVDAFLTGGGQ